MRAADYNLKRKFPEIVRSISSYKIISWMAYAGNLISTTKTQE